MRTRVVCALVYGLLTALPALGAEKNVMTPRVAPDEIQTARSLRNPLPQTPDTIEQGKTLYGGKGSCAICHGTSGYGDGVNAPRLDPSPRNFHRPGVWRHRTDGELFWTIKYGSAGTGMIAFGGYLSDEEIWAIITYEHTFAGKMDHGMGMDEMGSGEKDDHGHMGGMMRPHQGGCCRKMEPAPKPER
jgi:mono/diheme cytochrome c family protein